MKSILLNSFIQFSEEGGELVVDKMEVSLGDRGQLLGHKLLDIALVCARKMELNLSLYAESDNPDSFSNEELVDYYRDYGFVSDGDCDQLMTYEVV